jgi:sugar diacid utilization regulator
VVTTDLDTRRAALAQITGTLRARQVELVDRGVERIRTEIPAYARIGDQAFLADVRKHVDVHHDALIRSLEARHPPDRDEFGFLRPHVTRRVGRVPLADFMQGFRTYLEVFWEAILQSATDEQGRAAALEAAGIVIRYINIAATEAAEVYLEVERLLLAQGDRVRRDLLDDLLAGRAPAPGPKLTAAREAGLHPPAPCVVVVAVPRSPLADEHALRAVMVALARAVGSATAPLTVTRQEQLVLVARVGGDVGELVGAVQRTQERLASQGTPLAVGVSAVHSGLAETANAYAEARAAVERAPAGGGVVALPALSVFDCLTLFGRETANRCIPDGVRQFVAEDRAEGGILTMTLLEYVAADFNARATAERLFVHPNTARYRLGKIEERTGCNLRCVSDVMDLLIAVRVAQDELTAPDAHPA